MTPPHTCFITWATAPFPFVTLGRPGYWGVCEVMEKPVRSNERGANVDRPLREPSATHLGNSAKFAVPMRGDT